MRSAKFEPSESFILGPLDEGYWSHSIKLEPKVAHQAFGQADSKAYLNIQTLFAGYHCVHDIRIRKLKNPYVQNDSRN
jgi:hypothetical protein